MKCVANFGSNRVIIYHITTQRKNHHPSEAGAKPACLLYKRRYLYINIYIYICLFVCLFICIV